MGEGLTWRGGRYSWQHHQGLTFCPTSALPGKLSEPLLSHTGQNYKREQNTVVGFANSQTFWALALTWPDLFDVCPIPHLVFLTLVSCFLGPYTLVYYSGIHFESWNSLEALARTSSTAPILSVCSVKSHPWGHGPFIVSSSISQGPRVRETQPTVPRGDAPLLSFISLLQVLRST